MTTTSTNGAGARSKLPPPTKTVNRWEDVPVFDNEDDEHRFWAEHRLGGEALASMGSDPSAGDDELPPRRAEPGSHRPRQTRPEHAEKSA